jgi:hypothetical protein
MGVATATSGGVSEVMELFRNSDQERARCRLPTALVFTYAQEVMADRRRAQSARMRIARLITPGCGAIDA